jgi:hypothetical protein
MSCRTVYVVSTVNMMSHCFQNLFLRNDAQLAVCHVKHWKAHSIYIFRVFLENGNEFSIWGQSQSSLFQKCYSLWTFSDFKIVCVLCSKTSNYIYCNNYTIIRCNNIQIYGIPITCFNHPHGGISMRKNVIMTSYIIYRCAMVELKYKF